MLFGSMEISVMRECLKAGENLSHGECFRLLSEHDGIVIMLQRLEKLLCNEPCLHLECLKLVREMLILS